MTTPTDEGNADLIQDVEAAPIDNSNDGYVPEDDDPIIADMKAAEAEIAAGGNGEGDADTVDVNQTPGAAEGGQPAEQGKPDVKRDPIMVPKARLDEVLSERNLLRDQMGYMRGLLDAKNSAPAAPAATATAPAATTETQKPEDQGGANSLDTAIEAAEQKKLELAEKYDNGELSTRQWKEQELAIDKEIRALSNQRIEKVREESQADTQALLSAQQQAQWVNDQALAIQAKHQNVAVIDATPPHIRDGIWNQISAEAAQNLAKQGIDVRQATPQVKVALMQEKARLTDRYTPEMLSAFLPQGFVKPAANQQPSSQPGQKQPSETAMNRGVKLDLANSQPPSIADMGNGASQELTEADIENMSDDQMADLLKRNPNILNRIMGQKS